PALEEDPEAAVEIEGEERWVVLASASGTQAGTLAGKSPSASVVAAGNNEKAK
ncbi:MAG: hypothetical protein Q9226_008776, partial [Calogaya cf. arnoldii]